LSIAATIIFLFGGAKMNDIIQKDVKNVAVIGAGLMGKAIAFVFSSRYRVAVYDIYPVDLDAGIREIVKELVEYGEMSEDELERRLSQIQLVTQIDHDSISNADLVVESVFEDMDIKRKTFAQLEQICSDDCIFCTNTSVMSPSEISRDLQRRERFVATHFWNPAHLVPLVEVVMSDATSPQTAQTALSVLEGVDKKPILCKRDVPGFIGNRLQFALWREAFYMVEEGIADAKTIDDACKYGPGLRWPVLGPMENSDLIGLDLTFNMHNYLLKSLNDSHEPSPLIKEMLANGDNGMKTGKGWRAWTPEQTESVRNKLRAHLINFKIPGVSD
jgi:3-hydroxybutyryl-CoA dehydrogenase